MSNQNIYRIIEEKIISLIEENKEKLQWEKPWKISFQDETRNYFNKKYAYRGINSFITEIYSSFSGCNQFVTFKQLKEHGFKTTTEKPTILPIVYWNWITPKGKDEETTKKIPFARYYNVVPICETDIPAPEKENLKQIDFEPIQACEQVIAGFADKPEIRHNQQRAFYSPGDDFVNMPMQESFASKEEYYGVLFHELGHATGHQKRLARKTDGSWSFFGDKEYSKEELVAEFCSVFLCGNVGIEKTFRNSAAYLVSWLKQLHTRGKHGELIMASQQGQKASNYILNIKYQD